MVTVWSSVDEFQALAMFVLKLLKENHLIQMYFGPDVLKRGVGIVLDIMGAWRKLSHLYSAPASLM